MAQRVEPNGGVYEDRNLAKAVEVTDAHIIVTTNDERVIHVPISWFPFLENATPVQRQNFSNEGVHIYWHDLEDGISMQVVLLGRYGK